MRMWMVPPRLMCVKHLTGEHGELHKHLHNFQKQHSMTGRIAANCLEPLSIKARHDELTEEAKYRGFLWDSPLEQPNVSYLPPEEREYVVDVVTNFHELVTRCPDCMKRARIAASVFTLPDPRKWNLRMIATASTLIF